MGSITDLILPDNYQVADHAPLEHIPTFWDPDKAYAVYSPDLEGAFLEGVEYRRVNDLLTAQQRTEAGTSNVAMLTDLQHDFRPIGRLPVGGTDDVVLRACVRLLNGTVNGYYTHVVYSMDGHVPYHISWACRWVDKHRNPFDLQKYKAAQLIELVDRDKGVFLAQYFDPDAGEMRTEYIQSPLETLDTVAYYDHLQTTNQGNIWVFAQHCKIGTDGHTVHPLLAEVISFMEGALFMSSTPLSKGHVRDTDWFGPLKPCRPDPNHPQGGFQMNIVDIFREANGSVEFWGVAEDFCDRWMKEQVLEYFSGDPLFDQMAFLTDGTAPIIPNDPKVADLNQRAADLGVKFITHDAPFTGV